MTPKSFTLLVATIGLAFAAAFVWIVIPPLLQHPDIVGAFAAGFVNPYSSGYALDAICCWLVLAAWVVYEARAEGIRHGWIALLLGLAPGVATGFAFYLLLRMRQRGAAVDGRASA